MVNYFHTGRMYLIWVHWVRSPETLPRKKKIVHIPKTHRRRDGEYPEQDHVTGISC